MIPVVQAEHYKIIWPTPAPPVQTIYWDDEAWLKYCRGHRPAGYEGGEFDLAAFKAWTVNQQRTGFERFWPNLSFVYQGDDTWLVERK